MADTQTELQSMRAAIDAANRRAAEADNRAQRVEGYVQRAESGTRFAAQEQQVVSSISETERTLDDLERQQASLNEEGRFAEAAKIGRQMADAAARLLQLNGQKQYIEQQREKAATQPQQSGDDPYAGWPTEQRAWIDANPRFRSDQAFQRKVLSSAAHARDVRGLRENSPEWFEAIEREVYPERFDQQRPADQDGAGANVDESAALDGLAGGGDVDQPVRGPTVQQPSDITLIQPGQNGNSDTYRPEHPQGRAIGRGAPNLANTGVAPSRRLAELGAPVARKAVTLSPEEDETAMALVSAIDPKVKQADGSERFKSNDEMRQTYYAWLHDGSNTNATRNGTRRARTWAREAIVA